MKSANSQLGAWWTWMFMTNHWNLPQGAASVMLGLAAPIRIIKWQVEWGSWKSCSATHFSISPHIPAKWMSAVLTFQLTYDLVYLGRSAQSRRTMWPSTPLQLPLPSIPNASGWNDGPACFPNPLSPDRGGGTSGPFCHWVPMTQAQSQTLFPLWFTAKSAFCFPVWGCYDIRFIW